MFLRHILFEIETHGDGFFNSLTHTEERTVELKSRIFYRRDYIQKSSEENRIEE